jgi:hypothetical protein
MGKWMVGIGAVSWACAAMATGCGDDGSSGGTAGSGGSGTPTYEEVSAILIGDAPMKVGSCGAMTCHGGTGSASAKLTFKASDDFTAAIVNVPACENPDLNIVEPGDPEKSWLWIKLNAEIKDTNTGKIVYDGTPSDCVTSGFGTRMPGINPYDKLSQAKLDTIEAWIKGGAPGPK